jgi:hypothetical protein
VCSRMDESATHRCVRRAEELDGFFLRSTPQSCLRARGRRARGAKSTQRAGWVITKIVGI